jgi:hypothetical protein
MREFEPSLRGSIRKCAEGDDYGPRSHHRSVGVAYSNFHTHIDGGVRCGRPGLVNATAAAAARAEPREQERPRSRRLQRRIADRSSPSAVVPASGGNAAHR